MVTGLNSPSASVIIQTMIIDFHTHLFPPEIQNNRAKYLAREPVFKELYSDPRAKLADTADLLACLDEQGIDQAVVQNFQWTDPGLCHYTNQYIAEVVKTHPRRLFGFGMIVPDSPETALKEVEYCAAVGLRGIGEVRPSRAWLTAPAVFRPVIEALVSHKLILCTHSSEPLGHLYPGKGDLTPEVLFPFIQVYPDLKLVCAHWGGGLPFYALMPEVRRSLTNVYFDSAASPYLYQPTVYSRVGDLVGYDHLLFGSDFPLLKPLRLIRDVQTLKLDPAALNLFMGQNACKLLGTEIKPGE
jgi:predicted TIM-barrel fold metal-dependent hydrolase